MVRLGERAKEAIISVEGIYSMLGDVAPLAEIVDIKRRLGGYLIVDEAHSFGVLGATGRGLAEAVGVEDDVDIIEMCIRDSTRPARPSAALAQFAHR